MKHLQWLLFWVLIFPSGIISAQGSFTAKVLQEPVIAGQPFQVEWKIENLQGTFVPPDIGKLRLYQGPFSSSNISIINGVTTASQSFVYVLIAPGEGEFTISPATIVNSRGEHKSNKLTINVIKGSGNVVPAPPSQNAQSLGEPDPGTDESPDVFIQAHINNQTPYVGEAVNLVYRLYFRQELLRHELTGLPVLNGFWVENYKTESRVNQVSIKGKRYFAADLHSYLIFPQKAGELEIDPLAMDLTVLKRTSDHRSFFGRVEQVDIKVKSQVLKINALPLPSPVPASYKGATGNFNFQTTTDRQEVPLHQPLKYTITISGTGNLGLLDKPELPKIEGTEIYEPQVVDKYSMTASGMSGKRSWEFVIIPRKNDTLRIPSHTFSYFDPAKEKFETFTTGEYTIPVGPPIPGENYQPGPELSGKSDIRHIDEEADLEAISGGFTGSIWHWISILLPLAFLGVVAWVRQKRKEEENDPELSFKKKTKKEAVQRLQGATEALRNPEKEVFLSELTKAQYNFLAHIYHIKGIPDRSSIRSSMESAGSDEQLIRRWNRLLDDTEFARFSPTGDVERKSLLDRTRELFEEKGGLA